MFLTICISAIAAAAVIGLIVGLVKGFTECRTWANELVLTLLATTLISRLLNFDDTIVTSVATIACALICLLVFMALSRIFQRILRKRWKPFNRILGGLTLALKGAVLVTVFLGLILTVCDLIPLDVTSNLAEEVCQSSFWLKIKPFVFDFLLIALISFSLRGGYSNGIIAALWRICVWCMVVGAAVLAKNIAFNVETFATAGENLGNNWSFLASLGETTSALSESLTAAYFGKWIVTLGLFIVLFIVVLVISMVGRKLIEKAREGVFIHTLDGVLGALVMFIICVALLMVLFGFLYTFGDLEFMEGLNGYLTGALSKAFYQYNPLNYLGLFDGLSLAGYMK